MSDRVWLVRHASTEWTERRWCGRTDLPLSDVGVTQATELAARLAALLPSDVAIASSPARRALDTAQLIAMAVGASVEVMADLREVDFGAAEGRTWREIERELPLLARVLAAGATEIDWPQGETAVEVRDRVSVVQRRIDSAGPPLVLVSHGGLIRGLLDGMLGASRPIDRRVAPATAIQVERVDGGWALPAARVA